MFNDSLSTVPLVVALVLMGISVATFALSRYTLRRSTVSRVRSVRLGLWAFASGSLLLALFLAFNALFIIWAD